LLNPSDFELVSPPNPPNDVEGDAPNAEFCSPFIGADPEEDLPKLGTPLLTPPKPGGDDTSEPKVVALDLTPPPKPGTPLLTLLNPVGKDDLVSADVDLDLSPPKGDPPNTDFCSPFILPNDFNGDARKPATPLLTPLRPGGDDTFDSKPPPKPETPLLTPLKPVGEDDLVSTDAELDLSPPKEDPPNADFCSPFIVPSDPDEETPKPGTPLLAPPKFEGDNTFASKVVARKAGTPLSTPLKPVGGDDLVSIDAELDLSLPKGDPPNLRFCSLFIVPSDPDDDVPKPATPLLIPPKPGGDDTFASKVVELD
jgi:hypothetical protein